MTYFDFFYFTVMMYRAPLEFCVRIMDIFILEGGGLFIYILLSDYNLVTIENDICK